MARRRRRTGRDPTKATPGRSPPRWSPCLPIDPAMLSRWKERHVADSDDDELAPWLVLNGQTISFGACKAIWRSDAATCDLCGELLIWSASGHGAFNAAMSRDCAVCSVSYRERMSLSELAEFFRARLPADQRPRVGRIAFGFGGRVVRQDKADSALLVFVRGHWLPHVPRSAGRYLIASPDGRSAGEHFIQLDPETGRPPPRVLRKFSNSCYWSEVVPAGWRIPQG
jgi:hypothetical protein